MDSALVLLRRARETFLTAIEARRQGLEGLTLTLTYLYLFVFWPSYTLCIISSLSLAFSIIAPLPNLNVTLLLIAVESLSPDNSHHHQTALIPTIQRPGSLRIVQSMRILSFLLTN